MKYKAKASYKELDDTKNLWLLEGLEVEIKVVPDGLKEYLTEIKKTNKGGNK